MTIRRLPNIRVAMRVPSGQGATVLLTCGTDDDDDGSARCRSRKAVKIGCPGRTKENVLRVHNSDNGTSWQGIGKG